MVDRRLGRGLDFFLSRDKAGGSAEASASPAAGEPQAQVGGGAAEGLLMVELGQLVPNPDQPRQEISDEQLNELAASVRSAGVLQPILVRPADQGGYQIVAGERRFRAARRAGLERVPVVVRDITDEQSAVFALVENLQRADLNPLEKARAFRSLQSKLKCSQEEVARQVGFERSTVANFMRILDLPEAVQAHVSRGTLSMGQARALLGLPGDEIEAAADHVIRSKLSVRQVEQFVKDSLAAASATGPEVDKKPVKDAKGRPIWLTEIEENLVEALSTPVQVKYGRKRSKIVIECSGREEFERVYEMLKKV